MNQLTRRHVLRGAGVALALPWLESLAPRRARAQSAPASPRFVAAYFPLGSAPGLWTPQSTGQGDAWQLSPILQPLAPIKDHVTVLTHVDQTAYGPSPSVAPGNGFLTGAYLTCANGRSGTDAMPRLGVSIDQRIAQLFADTTTLSSLQVGLSTLDSYCDGAPCAYSRSISWQDATTPLGKLVDPQAVFDRIVAGGVPAAAGASAARVAARRSVLDFVVGDATSLEGRLGHGDRARMDQFLTSVRQLEQRIAPPLPAGACETRPRPTLSVDVGAVPVGYSREDHANVMIDLIVMALTCDVTRVVSFMLDDARSAFTYDFLQARQFTATGSTPGIGAVGSPLLEANEAAPHFGWATIDWWYVSKIAALGEKLADVPVGDGTTLLDDTIIWFGSGQQGETGATNLPLLTVGGGGGALVTNQSLDLGPSQRLSNVYLTFLRGVYGAADASFGDSTSVIEELLA